MSKKTRRASMGDHCQRSRRVRSHHSYCVLVTASSVEYIASDIHAVSPAASTAAFRHAQRIVCEFRIFRFENNGVLWMPPSYYSAGETGVPSAFARLQMGAFGILLLSNVLFLSNFECIVSEAASIIDRGEFFLHVLKKCPCPSPRTKNISTPATTPDMFGMSRFVLI